MPSSERDRLVSGFHSRGALPHLKREGGTYFVTFREANTLPRELLIRLKRERESILNQALAANRPLTWREQEDLFRWYSDRVDRYLDCSRGECHLRRPDCAAIVAGALNYFTGERYDLHSWVVMPNHVHVVVKPKPPHSLSDILHSWKSFTAHEINKVLSSKVAPFWQAESYDHLVRDDDDLHRCMNYVRMNPVSAGLCAEPQLWRWSSVAAAPLNLGVKRAAKHGSDASEAGGGTPRQPGGETPGATQRDAPANDLTLPP